MAIQKSKDDLKKEADQVKAIFDAAKKKDHNCAMVLCGDGSMAIESDPRLPAENLYKKARKRDGATTKGVMGVLSVKGSEMELLLSQEPPGGLETKLKQYLTKIGVKIKPSFILPDAENADGAASAAREEAPAEAKADKPDGEGAELSKAQLADDLKHITEIFKMSFEGMDEDSAKQLKAALKSIAASISSGDLVGAHNLMNKLHLLTGVGPDSPLQPITLAAKDDAKGDPESRKKAVTKEFQALKPEIQRSVRIANPAHKAEMETLIKSFGVHMKSGNVEDSEAALEAFKKRIASFDQAREEGRRAREAKYNDIVARVAKLKERLEIIKAEGGAA